MNKILYISSMISLSLLLDACGGSGSGGNQMVDQNHNPEKAQEKVDKTVTIEFNKPDRGYDELVTYLSVKLNGHRFTMVDNKISVDYSVLKQGLADTDVTVEEKEDDGDHNKVLSRLSSYNQFYSAVIASRALEEYKNGGLISQGEETSNVGAIAGLPTSLENIPTHGVATYKGIAFVNTENAGTSHGNFDYTVDFASKSGYGSYTLNNVLVTLKKGSLASADSIKDFRDDISLGNNNGVIFDGDAVISDQALGRYMIGLYGPHAEEAAGAVKANSSAYWEIGLGGRRGDIIK